MSEIKTIISNNILPVELRDIPTIMKGEKGERGRDGSYVQKAYKTYASMLADKASIPANSNVVVNNDPDKTKNAFYTYDGITFTKGDFDPQVVLETIDSRLDLAVESASEYFQSQVADTVATAVATSINNSTVAYNQAIEVTKGEWADTISTTNASIKANSEAYLATIPGTVNDAINNTAVEGGVLAATFVTVEEQITGEGALSLRDFNSRTILTVNSIAELLQVKATSGRAVFVKDSQGGVFVYDSSKSAIDDGGLVINGWVRQLQTPYITPEMFGCKGDGVADDSIAMGRFAAASHRHKVASKTYKLTTTPSFAVKHQNTIIDFSSGTIIGTEFDYCAIEITNNVAVKSLTIKTGDYDGGGLVNMYINAYSSEAGFCERINIDCKGVLDNFSNSKNTRSTSGIYCALICDYICVTNPNVSDVHNINGLSSITSAIGLFIGNYQKLCVVNSPIINGVYTNSGVDADGIALFERKGVSSTGTAWAVVYNPDLKQVCGRGIKSQGNLKVRGLTLGLKPPSKGVISTSGWRAIDVQLGARDVKDATFNLHKDCFLTGSDSCITTGSPSLIDKCDNYVSDIKITGGSNIRYVCMHVTGDTRSTHVSNITSVDYHPELSVLYAADVNISDNITISNIKGKFNPNMSLFLHSYMTGRCASFTATDIAPSLLMLDISKFDKVNINMRGVLVGGVINYNDININSDFYYVNDPAGGTGITYTTSQDIPSWAKTYCYYKKGAVYATFYDDILSRLGAEGNFYKTSLPTATLLP